MEGTTTGQVRYESTTIAHAVRAAAELSQASVSELSRELEINPPAVAKWRKPQAVEDWKTGLKAPRSTIPGEEGA